MAVQFPVPASQPLHTWAIDYFKGIDLNNAAANVEKSRSPDAPNMIRDQVGKVRKRMGWHTVDTLPGRINGRYTLDGQELIHAGTTLQLREEDTWKELSSTMADERSTGFVFQKRLYILDGKTYLRYDGKKLEKVTDVATVPTIIISRNPSGGGVPYEPLNLCARGWKESYLGDGKATIYQLTTTDLAADPLIVEQMDEKGKWQKLTLDTDYTVDRKLGRVTFVKAPPVSPVTGRDNVRITAYKDREGYEGRINGMNIATLYGVNGAPDRVFVAGNLKYKNIDYYSERNDPTFFGDTSYSPIGQTDAEIVGYSIIGNLLATHKASGQDGRNVIVRTGNLNEKGIAKFPIVNTLKGKGAVSRYAFQSLRNEPLFLTESGVYGITSGELTGERINELRSLNITEALRDIPDLSNAAAWIYHDFYMLSVGGGRVFLLDGLQREYSKDAPWSSHQFECYELRNVPARIAWEADDTLMFGTDDGRICAFYTDELSAESYNDDGAPITAYWDTPDITGKMFSKNKTFRSLSLMIAAASQTSCRVLAQKRGIWSQIYDAGQKARFFDWTYIDFSKFVFSTDRTPHTLTSKIKIKKVDKCRFRIINDVKNEPFGLYAFATEFTESRNNYKG